MFTCVIFVNPGFTFPSPNHPQKIFNKRLCVSPSLLFQMRLCPFGVTKKCTDKYIFFTMFHHAQREAIQLPAFSGGAFLCFSSSYWRAFAFQVQKDDLKRLPNLLTLLYYSVFDCISFFEILYFRPFFNVTNTVAWHPAACRIQSCYTSR